MANGSAGQLHRRAKVGRGNRLPHPLQLGHVGVVEVGDVRDRAGRLDHLGGDRAADLRHPLAADRAVGVRRPIRPAARPARGCRAGRECPRSALRSGDGSSAGRSFWAAAARTSSTVTRPPLPLPATLARSTPNSRASRRASGPAATTARIRRLRPAGCWPRPAAALSRPPATAASPARLPAAASQPVRHRSTTRTGRPGPFGLS